MFTQKPLGYAEILEMWPLSGVFAHLNEVVILGLGSGFLKELDVPLLIRTPNVTAQLAGRKV